MDPFTAIGLAGNVITFLEFGYSVISKVKEIGNSTSGGSSSNQALASVAKRLQDVALSLPGTGPTATVSSQCQSLEHLGTECQRVSEDLLKLLESLRAKDATSKRSILWAALRETSGKKRAELRELEKRLDRCRQQLNLELTSLVRYGPTLFNWQIGRHV